MRSLFRTRRVVAALVVLLLGGLAAIGVARATIETGASSFLPASDPSLRQFEELASSFGGDPIVVLLESDGPRQLLGQGELAKVFALEGELSRLSGAVAVYGPASTLNGIAGQAQVLLLELTGRRDGIRALALAQAQQRGASPARAAGEAAAAVAEFDRRYGPLIVEGLPAGLPTLRNPQFVQRVIFTGEGRPRPQWTYLVPSDHAVAILVRPRPAMDQRATEALVRDIRGAVDRAGLGSVRATVAGAPVIAAEVGAQVHREIPLVSLVAVVVVGICLLAVRWGPRRRQRLVPLAVSTMATGLTVAVLGWLNHPISLGVLASLPVLVGLGGYYPAYFSRRARPRVVLLVAGATAAGFASLALSPLPFVRDLGLTLALGVGFAVLLGWLLVGRSASGAAEPSPGATAVAAPRRIRWLAGATALAVAVCGWAALPNLALQTNISDLTEGLPVVRDAEHAISVLGSSSELDVVLAGRDVLTPEAWRWLRTTQDTIVRQYGDEAHPVLSPIALTGFLGPDPTAEQIRAATTLLPRYLTSAVLTADNTMAVQSFGVKLDDLHRTRTLIDSIRATLPPPPPGYQASITGLPAVAARGDELVSGSRYLTNLAGILAAGIVLLLGLRRRRTDVLRALASGLLATGATLLLLWAADVPLNPLTVALGSLTAAVGCEFTVMLAEAVRRGDRSLRTAVVLAALTSGVGYLVLGISQLAVMRHFGLLLAGSVLLSYLAARFVVWLWPPSAAPVEHRADRCPELVGSAKGAP